MAKVEKKVCLKCGESKRLGDFYKSNSELNSDGKLPICKECVAERYETLLSIYEGKMNDAWRHLCYNLDIFYDEGLYLQCSSKDNFIGEYMRIYGATKDRRHKTSLNNLLGSGEIKEIALEDGVISESLMVEWGRNRSKDDYLLLEKRYNELITQFPSKSSEEKYIIKDICKLELDIEECRKNGKIDKIASLENVKSKKMQQIDAIPSEKKNGGSEDDVSTFALRLKLYEKDRPIPKPLDEFKDCDALTDYWERNLVKPMARMQGLATGDYSLEKGADDIEYTPEYKEVLRELEKENE